MAKKKNTKTFTQILQRAFTCDAHFIFKWEVTKPVWYFQTALPYLRRVFNTDTLSSHWSTFMLKSAALDNKTESFVNF